MKYIKQAGVIAVVLLLAEAVRALLPFPIPASIYGLGIMLLGLLTGVIKLNMVEETADWLVEIMGICFIPASVALVNDWDILKPFLIPLVIMCMVSSVAVFGASGTVTQFLVRRRKKEEEEKHA